MKARGSRPSSAVVKMRPRGANVVERLEGRQLLGRSCLISAPTRYGGICDARRNQIDVPTTGGTVIRGQSERACRGVGGIRAIDSATGNHVAGGPSVAGATVTRGLDRSLVYASDTGISPSGGYASDAKSHTWVGGIGNGGGGGGASAAAVSPTGSEVATGSGFVNRTLGLIRTGTPSVVRIGYDPTGNILCTLGSGQVVAIDGQDGRDPVHGPSPGGRDGGQPARGRHQ